MDSNFSEHSGKDIYHTGWRRERTFCFQSVYHDYHQPPGEGRLTDFVAHCARHYGFGLFKIKLYLCGVRHRFIILGYGDIMKDTPRLLLTLRGMKG